MKVLKREELKPFQMRAAGDLSRMLSAYPNPPYKKWFNPATGEAFPFVCRLRAITGSGKTPILALSMASLGDAVVLWTTNRGAVISQTFTNLSSGGRYSTLLPENVQILDLSVLSMSDWNDVISTQNGLTIILSTVALFNREGDALNVHKDRNGTSYWEMLSGQGLESRARPLYVVYDEAHGGTTAQFSRLAELRPRAFVLASASDFPSELATFLPGMTIEEKSDSLKNQTVVAPTEEVVKEGLLKNRIYFVDCNTTRRDALKEANDRWFSLSEKLETFNEWPIMCCIVNSTLSGLEVWETLTQDLKVDPRRIAVHLANVEKQLAEANPNVPWAQMIDTYKAKKSPEALHDEGYTHLIWNLSLREGWDEPWAYVAYLDGSGKSTTDISQKIGRFLRQPNATPFDDGDLNSAYFYFNVPDEDFVTILKATQSELESQGYEVITIGGNDVRPPPSVEAALKRPMQIAKVAESFGEDLEALDNILIDSVPLFAPEELRAPGRVLTRVLDLRRNAEDNTLQKEEFRDDNAETTAWEYLISRLGAYDSRIAKKNSTCFTHSVRSHPRLKQRMQFGSPAMEQLNRYIPDIIKRLNNEFQLEYEPDQVYDVKNFNLVSPNLQIDDAKKRDRYRVHSFTNALHSQYNGFNAFELAVAQALDTLGMDWCRNPSKTGYGIPIPELGQGNARFYPDFLLWTAKYLWAIDPKGTHLANDAIQDKLMALDNIDGMPVKMRVALVLDGHYSIDQGNRIRPGPKKEFTLIIKRNNRLVVSHNDKIELLVAQLK